MTATLEAPADAEDPPREPPNQSRPVPAALAPWQNPNPRLGWLVTALVTVLAAVTRFWSLGFPPGRNVIPQNGMNFDEIYYATEAQEILRYGYEDNRGYMFIVHPPVGKWLIAASEWLFGDSSQDHLTNSLGWRVAPAIAGVIGVVLVSRTVGRMMRSNLLAAIAGVLMSFEGLSLVLARTAILDIFLQLFIFAAFAALVVDRDQVRGRLAGLLADGADLTDGLPTLGPRPWRLVAGVTFGLAIGVKWTALSFFAFFVVLSLFWDRAALKSAGVRRPTLACLRRSVPFALGSLFVTPIATYLFTWLGWFSGENSWNRHWADTHGTSAHVFGLPFNWGWVPGPIRSLGAYTLDAYRFHQSLDSGHAYQSNPWSWLVLGRPVDFYYDGSATACGASSCSREVLLIGTPLMWWAIPPMLLWLAWHWVTTRDWRAGAVWVAFGAGWLVWFQNLDRTMFLFYMAPLIPFMVIGITLALGVLLGPGAAPLRRLAPGGLVGARLIAVAAAMSGVVLVVLFASAGTGRSAVVAVLAAVVLVGVAWELYERWRSCDPSQRRRFWGVLAVATYLGLVVADFAWMWPLFTGGLLTYDEWHAHMWLPSWV